MAGSVEDRPRIINVKKIPTDRTWAEFWNVWFIPPPAPRCWGGRLFITAARFGEANMPIEMPIISSTPANAGNGKSIGSRPSRKKLNAEPSIPPVANQRAPKRSDRYPEVGPATIMPSVSGSM